jgi:hypothetical protein
MAQSHTSEDEMFTLEFRTCYTQRGLDVQYQSSNHQWGRGDPALDHHPFPQKKKSLVPWVARTFNGQSSCLTIEHPTLLTHRFKVCPGEIEVSSRLGHIPEK